ncbi:MAG TPA: Hsp20/alpha crystallin family protein [Ilumatobacteraceae bacterium]|jgi:HSP20 family protein|nr:Hsp20/alpha crystallin family protein [Ilumatobacteraceae bacterium]
MTKQLEVHGKGRPITRLLDWFDPLDMPRFFDMFRPFEDRIPVEEELVDGNLVIRAEMPGVDPDKDVKIVVEDDVLTVNAERHREESKKTEGGFRSEFHYGSFSRSMRLPKGTTAKNVKASYHDGILEVMVPAPKRVDTAQKIAISKN